MGIWRVVFSWYSAYQGESSITFCQRAGRVSPFTSSAVAQKTLSLSRTSTSPADLMLWNQAGWWSAPANEATITMASPSGM